MRKPEKRFQKLRKKDITMAAIWGPGVRAITIIPYNVKYIKHIKINMLNHKNFSSRQWNPIIE